jgi:hypothetical protein
MRPSLLAILLALSACGDDSGGSDAAGDPADAFVDPADAPDEADAFVAPPDAGDVTGLDQVCTCEPSTACPGDLDCFVNMPSPPHFLECGTDAGIGESGVCRPRVASCDTNAMDCPFPSRCLTFSDGATEFGVCAPAAGDDEACRPERCPDAWLCVGPNDDNAFCREECTADATVCEANETCTPVGMSRMACVPTT